MSVQLALMELGIKMKLTLTAEEYVLLVIKQDYFTRNSDIRQFLDIPHQFYVILSFYHLGRLKFLHQGHCAGTNRGYISPSTNQETIEACRIECESRPKVKYIAYKSESSINCACYTTECNNDDTHQDHNAYEILKPGNRILFENLPCLFFRLKNINIYLHFLFDIV